MLTLGGGSGEAGIGQRGLLGAGEVQFPDVLCSPCEVSPSCTFMTLHVYACILSLRVYIKKEIPGYLLSWDSRITHGPSKIPNQEVRSGVSGRRTGPKSAF